MGAPTGPSRRSTAFGAWLVPGVPSRTRGRSRSPTRPRENAGAAPCSTWWNARRLPSRVSRASRTEFLELVRHSYRARRGDDRGPPRAPSEGLLCSWGPTKARARQPLPVGDRNLSSKTCPSLGETRARPGAPRSLRGRSRRICLKGTPGTGTWNRRQAPGEPIGQAAYGLCPGREEKEKHGRLLPSPPWRLGLCPLPTVVEDLTIKWRRQILQSEAESQRIAVRKLLNRLQHPGWYVSRLQTIRCGYTACGG